MDRYPTQVSCEQFLEQILYCLNLSVHGVDVNKSYLDENKSNYSVSDISTWFQTKSANSRSKDHIDELLKSFDDVAIETKMTNFRELLLKVKEIIDGSFKMFKHLTKSKSN